MSIKNKKFSYVEGILYNYNSMKAQLNSYKIELEYLNIEYEGCKGKSYLSIPSNTNTIYSSVESELIKKENQKELLESKIRKTDMQIRKLENALNLLDNEELELVKFRYFSNRTVKPSWVEVAAKIGYSDKTCRAMRNKIIEKIQKII